MKFEATEMLFGLVQIACWIGVIVGVGAAIFYATPQHDHGAVPFWLAIAALSLVGALTAVVGMVQINSLNEIVVIRRLLQKRLDNSD